MTAHTRVQRNPWNGSDRTPISTIVVGSAMRIPLFIKPAFAVAVCGSAWMLACGSTTTNLATANEGATPPEGSPEKGGTPAIPDASSGTDAQINENGVLCCPPDAEISGEMNLGGAAPASGKCFESHDFWCSVNWRLEKDAKGCMAWHYDTRAPKASENAQCLAQCSGLTCPVGSWCNRGVGVCGHTASGVCEPLPPPPPPSCPFEYCGCDGKTYCSAEHAHGLGIEIAVKGTCAFACGDKTCNALTEVCDHGTGGAPIDGGLPESWQCQPLPSACTNSRTCACVTSVLSADSCVEPDGHVEIQHLWP